MYIWKFYIKPVWFTHSKFEPQTTIKYITKFNILCVKLINTQHPFCVQTAISHQGKTITQTKDSSGRRSQPFIMTFSQLVHVREHITRRSSYFDYSREFRFTRNNKNWIYVAFLPERHSFCLIFPWSIQYMPHINPHFLVCALFSEAKMK